MLFAVTALKMIAELALLALVGHGLLRLLLQRLAPQSLASNPFLWLLATLCRPPLWLVARLSPPSVLPRHHPWLALALMAGLWLAATYLKIRLCLDLGMEHCR